MNEALRRQSHQERVWLSKSTNVAFLKSFSGCDLKFQASFISLVTQIDPSSSIAFEVNILERYLGIIKIPEAVTHWESFCIED